MTPIEKDAVKKFNATLKRTEESTYVVSYWTDVWTLMSSELTEVFFKDKTDANNFCASIDCIEQRPQVLDLSQEDVDQIYRFG